MEQDSWRRNLEEESWRRNHGGGIMEEEPWRRNLEGVMMEASGKHLAGIWREAFVGIWRHLGSIWEASGKHLGCIWEASGKGGI